jgi:hypothetical protein
VQGTWSLESVAVNGVPDDPQGGPWVETKVIGKAHFAWVAQQGGSMPLASTADSLADYRTRAFGGGAYRIADSRYVERLDYFYDPRYLGREVAISCPSGAAVWQAAFDWSMQRSNQPDSVVHIVETWRRIE